MRICILILSFLLSFLANSQTTVKRDTIRVGTDSAVVTQTTTTIYNKTASVPYTYKDTTTSISQYKIKVSVVTPPPPTNLPPIARAGNDFTVTVQGTATATVTLDASASTDPEGQTLKFYWRKVTGTTVIMTDTTKPIATASGLGEGDYVFEVRAVDPSNAFSADTIKVTVKKEVVTPPTGSSFPFSLTKNTAFKKRAFSGTEDWNGQFYTSFTGGFSDKYFRFVWADIEKQTQGNYVWTRFDQEANKAFAVGAKFSFGIATLLDSDDFLAYETFTGSSAWARYPKYVHDFMQTQSVKDYVTNSQWVPAWNNDFFLTRYAALLKAVADHIDAKGWHDRINYVDIRGYGQWGEWHMVNIVSDVANLPSGIRPTVATYKRFIDAHIAAFQDYPLVMLLATLDANWLPHTMTPPEVTYYALTAKNKFGLIGIRRDQWGAQDQYVKDYMENNNRSYNGVVFKTLIMERWKYAPLVGEPFGPGADLSDLPRQVTFYHATSVGNGNYTANTTSQNYFRTAENNAGYKIALQSGNVETSSAFDLRISFSAENFGNTSCYEVYDLTYQLKNTAGIVVWTGTSIWHPDLKLPGVHSISDVFKVSGLTAGTTYTISATIKNNYRAMPLFNNSQSADGSLLLTTLKF